MKFLKFVSIYKIIYRVINNKHGNRYPVTNNNAVITQGTILNDKIIFNNLLNKNIDISIYQPNNI